MANAILAEQVSSKAIGERIRAARKALNMNQTEVAVAVGVTSTTVARWELGHASPYLEHIVKIANLLGVDARTLAFGTEG
jgi:transcriptional regulator with XRE-family HTH domain